MDAFAVGASALGQHCATVCDVVGVNVIGSSHWHMVAFKCDATAPID